MWQKPDQAESDLVLRLQRNDDNQSQEKVGLPRLNRSRSALVFIKGER